VGELNRKGEVMTLYHGGCHCGRVRYSVELDGLGKPVACNCSRCQKLASLLVFAPASAFTLEKGDGETTEYLFNHKTIQHLFCRTCGIESFALSRRPDGTEMVAINVNCLDGVEPRELEITLYDGRSK
jgi:hypothetical protein